MHGPHSHGTAIVRHGQTQHSKHRYQCRDKGCMGRTFLLAESSPGASLLVTAPIVEMALPARGMRDTARVVHVRTNTVMPE